MTKMITTCITMCLAAFVSHPLYGQTKTFSFDDVADLGTYASDGVTFTPNIGLWGPNPVSVLDDPDSGPVTTDYGICVGNCGGEAGSIFFDTPQNYVSIWALSGPGSDTLIADTRIRAKDSGGNTIGEVFADTSLQFDLLAISTPGIVELELFSPNTWSEAWDHLTISDLDLVLQIAPTEVVEGQGLSIDIAKGPVGGFAMLAVSAIDGIPLFFQVALGTYDAGGRFTLRATVPPGVTGFDASFIAIGQNLDGWSALTNEVTVQFQ